MTGRMCVSGLVAWGLLALGLSGCISVRSGLKLDGKPVSGDTLKQVEDGKTTKGWLLAALGEPDLSRSVDKSTEVLVYRSKETTHKSTNVTFLFDWIDADNETETQREWLFELRDGIVHKHWTAVTSIMREGRSGN